MVGERARWRVETEHNGGVVRLDLPVRTIGRADGLPTGQVHHTSPDDRGRLWMATPNGLTCWDGSRVTSFAQAQGLSSHGLRCVRVDGDGAVWIGSDVGVDVLRPDGAVERMFAGWRWGLANDIAVGFDGTVWVAAAQGLIRWTEASGWVSETDPRVAGMPVHKLTVDRSGRLWAVSRHVGALIRTDHGWEAPESDQWRVVGAVHSISASDDATVVIGGTNGLAIVDAAGGLLDSLLDIGSVHAAFVTRHSLWVGTGNDLRCYRLTDGTWTPTATVVEHTRVNHITSDRHGNVWAATDSFGVVKVEAIGAALERPLLPTGAVFAIHQRGQGDYLVAGDQRSGVLHAGDTTSFTPLEPLAGHKVWDLLETRKGTVWAATEGGLLRLDGDVLSSVGADHPVLAAPGRVLLERREGIWVGTLNGLVIVGDDGSINAITTADHASLGYVYTLVADGDTVWVGTLGNGLWRHRHDRLERVDGEGLTTSGNTYSVTVGSDRCAIALQDNCIVSIPDGEPPRLLTTTDEAVSGWACTFDRSGSLWVGSSTGLCEYSSSTGHLLQRVTLWLGIDGWEFTTSRSLLVDHTGSLMCGLNSGIVIVHPAGLAALNGERPSVGLARLTWSNATPTHDADGHLNVRQGRWTFDAQVFSTWPYYEASRLFRYRLLGFEPTWSAPTTSAQIQFSSLPPGGYTLEAQCHSPLCGWGEATSVLTFDVLHRNRMRRLLGSRAPSRAITGLAAENHALEQRVRQRMNELVKLQDELERANHELQRLSLTDPLTEVANRRRFDHTLADELARSRETDRALSLLMVDVDEFKSFNDRLGHVEGDRCLRAVAAVLTEVLRRDVDLPARYGGEEFAVLLPDTDAATALVVAERVRTRVAMLGILHPSSSTSEVVTASIGVATTVSGRETSPRDLVRAADQALYTAKRAGRNRVSADTSA